MKGLLGGLSSIAYIVSLLLLALRLYGIIGFYLYGESDPFHFGTSPLALLIILRASLLDNWSDVTYVNVFGCDERMKTHMPPEEEASHNSLRYCHNPKKRYYDAPVYFISFVDVSAFATPSLFIGAITMSMCTSTNWRSTLEDAPISTGCRRLPLSHVIDVWSTLNYCAYEVIALTSECMRCGL